MSTEIIDLASRRAVARNEGGGRDALIGSPEAGRQYVAHPLMEAAEAIAGGAEAAAIVPVRNVFHFLERYVNQDNTDRGHARGYLLAAAEHVAGDDISRALASTRMALRVLEVLGADGVTLEEDRRRLEIRTRRIAAASKAAATRRRNREAAGAARE